MSSLDIQISQETGEIHFLLSSGALLTGEQYQERVRKLLASKSIGNLTGSLAEDHLAYLLRLQTNNSVVGIIDRHSGAMPDICVIHEDVPYFIEVKTGGKNNQIVLKKGQVVNFSQGENNCFYAFTEHNLIHPKSAMSKKGGRTFIANNFGLVRVLIVPSYIVRRLYDSDGCPEYDFLDESNGSYKNFRISRICRVLEQIGYRIEERTNGKVLFVAEENSSIPEFFPDESLCETRLGGNQVDCREL